MWKRAKITCSRYLILLAALLFFTTSAQAATVDIVQNGSFAGTLNNWANWAFSATGAQTSFTAYPVNNGPNAASDVVGSLNLTQTGLTGLNSGPGALGAGQITLNIGWNTCTVAPMSLQIYVAGTLYGTFSTPASANTGQATGTTTYSNGASGSSASTIPASTFTAWTYYPWTINLPTSVASSGDIKLSFVESVPGCGADVSLKSMSVVVNRPTLTVSKTSLGATGTFSFAGDNGFGTNSITTSAQGTATNGAVKTLSAGSTATSITETIPTGYAVTALSCSGMGSGSATYSLSLGSVTLNAAATAPTNNVTCAYTDTKLPTVQLSKTSTGGVGVFNFTGTNGFGTDAITTSTQGTAVSGALKTLSAASTSTAITEAIPAGYAVTAISCTGLGTGGTATPNLAAGSVTLDTAATAPGSAISCNFANAKLPTVQLSKTSTGGVGTFNFSGTNGFGTDAITTASQGTAVSGALKTLTAASTSTAITEAIPAGYAVTAISCTGVSAANYTTNLTTGVVTLNSAATAPGSVINCSYTNAKLPTVQLSKTSNGGVGTFNFFGTNGYGTDTITTSTQGTAVSGVVKTLTSASTSTVLTETIPLGYAVTAISCTGLATGGTASPNLTLGSVTLDAAATAPGSTISCSFFNDKLPTIRLSKTSNGGIGTFNFTGDNGFGTDAITTSNSGTVVSGTLKTLTKSSTVTNISETIPAGYVVTSVNCTGQGSGGVTTINVSAGTISLDALATAPGKNILCNYVDTKLPTLQISKTSNGGVGTFNFSGTNGFGTDTITTTAQGTAVNGTLKTLSNFNTAMTLNETIPSTYFLSGLSCSGLGSGTATYDPTTGTVSLNSAATAAGNAITCSYTNTFSNPSLSVVKSADTAGPVAVGQVITYTFIVSNNGNRPLTNVSLSEIFNGTGTAPIITNESLQSDAVPAGDSSDITVNNGVWSQLGVGDQVKFTANYTVTQSDIETLQ